MTIDKIVHSTNAVIPGSNIDEPVREIRGSNSKCFTVNPNSDRVRSSEHTATSSIDISINKIKINKEILSDNMRDLSSIDLNNDEDKKPTHQSVTSSRSNTCKSFCNIKTIGKSSNVPLHERLGITVSQLDFLKNMAIEYYFGVVVKKKKPDKIFECEVCGKVLRNNTNLKRHMQCHNPVKAYRCEICDKDFSDKYYFKLHYKRHSGNFPYMCGICQRPFLQKCTLDEHLRRHTGERPYKCQYCDKTFSTNGIMLEHQRTHTGEKPYKCKICSKAFTQGNTLRQHMSVHSNENDHVNCDICGKSFSCRSYLKIHMKVHQKGNPLHCSVCQKKFNCSRSLNRHMRVHTGEKPFKCQICGRQFSQKSNLYKHKKVHREKLGCGNLDKPTLAGKENNKKANLIGDLIPVVSTETSCYIKHEDDQERPIENSLVTRTVLATDSPVKLVSEHSIPVQLTLLKMKREQIDGFPKHDKSVNTVALQKFDVVGENLKNKSHSKITINSSLIKKKFLKNSETKSENEKIVSHSEDQKIEPLLCDICNVAFYKTEHMQYHMKCHEANFYKKLFVCKVCYHSFPNKLLMTAHSKVHKLPDKSGTTCDICQQKFTCKKNLCSHRNKIHPLKIGERNENLKTAQLVVKDMSGVVNIVNEKQIDVAKLPREDFGKIMTSANGGMHMYLEPCGGGFESLSDVAQNNRTVGANLYSIQALMKSEPVSSNDSMSMDARLNQVVGVSHDTSNFIGISRIKSEYSGKTMNKLEKLLRAPLSAFPKSPFD